MNASTMTITNPQIVYFVATSLDGLIAFSDGGMESLSSFGTSADDGGWRNFMRR